MRRIALVAVVLLIGACSSDDAEPTTTVAEATATSRRATTTTLPPQSAMTLSSPAFAEGSAIPLRYTCDGEDVSPELIVSEVPRDSRSIALIVDDPDAPLGTWDHWVEYDITSETTDLVIPADSGPIGIQGLNSWNVPGYGGPCPPQGEEHRYFFTVFALDTELALPDGTTSEDLRLAMDGHVMREARLMGIYGR